MQYARCMERPKRSAKSRMSAALNPVRSIWMADVRSQVMLSLSTDFENMSVFKPAACHEQSVNAMLDQLIAWGGALKTLRV